MPANEFIETQEPQLTRAERIAFNSQWIDSVKAAQNGTLVKTSSQASTHIRKRIRENLFTDEIVTPVPVTDADLDRFTSTDLPGIIEDMEHDQPIGAAIPFSDSPSKWIFRGDKFTVYFCTITTPIMTKNVDELRTYKMDLRQVTTDNMLKDLGTLKDIRYMQTIDDIVGSVGGVGLSGEEQNVEINGLIRRTSYVPLVNYIQDRELNNGIWLMNRHTATEFLKWGRDEIGGDMAQELLTKGLKAMSRFEIVGVPHLATIKRSIVPDNVIYQFTEQGYFGRHYVLQDTTMHVEKKIDMLEFHARAKYGISLPGVRGGGPGAGHRRRRPLPHLLPGGRGRPGDRADPEVRPSRCRWPGCPGGIGIRIRIGGCRRVPGARPGGGRWAVGSGQWAVGSGAQSIHG